MNASLSPTLSPKQLANALSRNAWDWDLIEFARRIGENPATEHTRQLFRDFQELARLLGRFDDDMLAVLCER